MILYPNKYILAFTLSIFLIKDSIALSVFGPIKSVGQNIIVPYSIYSFAIDKYAQRKVKLMKEVPAINLINNNNYTTNQKILSPNELRKTISKRNYLVVNPKDRLEWNRFITSNNNVDNDKISSIALNNDLKDICGVYQFAYRSYVNFEEVSAFCKPFYNWRQLSLVLKSRGVMTIKKINEENVDDGIFEVTNVEKFRFGLFIPLTFQWYGKIINYKCNDGNDNTIERLKIVWGKTEMRIGNRVVANNPKVAVQLSSTAWDIIKLDDGMICFQRGDVGYLVYDRDVTTI